MKNVLRFAIAMVLAFTLYNMNPDAGSAQVTPANGTPQISASVPGGAFNIFPYVLANSMGGNYKWAIYQVSCTPSASTSCTESSATTVLPTTGSYATQFSAAPMCVSGMDNASVAIPIAVKHSWNGSFTTDQVTITASASTSSLLEADVFCVGT